MTFIEKIQRINRLHDLIRRKATGTPKELARKFEVSERCIYDCIETMKSMGAPIYYCRSNQSYCYEYMVSFMFGFESQVSYQKVVGGGRIITLAQNDLLQNICSGSVYLNCVNGH